ncbi:MAG: prepilin peptidase [Deltaproteobacteria bacterium]|nr:prepilin peptidase [Deltaproteobacteria bacterium]
MIAILFFILGGYIGSFLNVCIYRLPQNRSIVAPRSFCPECKTYLKFYHNIPIISYIILKGVCPFCKKKISFLYITVELLTGFFALLYFLRFGFSPDFAFFFLFTSLLIIISFIDLQRGIIPNSITIPFILIGFAFSFVLKIIKPFDSFLGILTGAALLTLVAAIYKAVAKKNGIGEGDIKLLAMIGAFIGFKGVLFAVIIGSLSGSITGTLVLIIMKKKDSELLRRFLSITSFMPTKAQNPVSLPFAPFLSAGALLYIFFGDALINWYINFFEGFM